MSNDIEKDWTIMVYMAGDNNLSENMAIALEDIRGAFVNIPADICDTKINLLAFFDGNSLTAPTKYIDFSDVCDSQTKPLRQTPTAADIFYKNSDTPAQQVTDDDLSEGNAASAYSILNFVRWCLVTQKRKAKNYALIFSGHSFGFHGTSFLRDESTGESMTLFKFRWALEKIKSELLGNQKIDILGFDSCVMSMLEVGYELKDVAQTMIASEGSLPNNGWSYSPLLLNFISNSKKEIIRNLDSALSVKSDDNLNLILERYNLNPEIFSTAAPLSSPPAKNSDAEDVRNNNQIENFSAEQIFEHILAQPAYVRETAKCFVNSLLAHHTNLLIGGRSIDMAAWDLEKCATVVGNVNLFAGKLNEYLDLSVKIHAASESNTLQDSDIEIFHQLRKIILQSHYDSQTYMNEQCVDLADFCKRFIVECKFMEKDAHGTVYTELINLAKNIILSVKDCVLISGFSGDEYQFSNGISIYFPWSNLTFQLTNRRYRYLQINKGTLDDPEKEIEDPLKYNGAGVNWYLFLWTYIFRVSLRQLRKTAVENDGQTVTEIASFENFSKSNPVWSKSNPVWSKSNPIWSKSNPDASRSNPIWSKSNPVWSKSNPDASRSNPDASRGELGNYLFYFSRFKNFQYQWDIAGFADEFDFENDFDSTDSFTAKS